MRRIVDLDIQDPVLQQLALQEAYDSESGIYPYYDDVSITRPLAVIALHPAEDQISGTLLDRWLKRFSELAIHTEFGISFDAFLQMDMLTVANIWTVAKDIYQRKSKIAEKMQSELDKEKKEAKEEVGVS